MYRKFSRILLFITPVIFLIGSFNFFIIQKDDSRKGGYYKASETSSSFFNNLTTVKQKIEWQSEKKIKLLARNKLTGRFTANTDNFGTIAIPFDTKNRSIEDDIIFRIKETRSKDWYYQNVYNANQIQNSVPFPFGFPVIKNSKNKSFVLEIESSKGTKENSLGLGGKNQYFYVNYKFTGKELKRNPIAMAGFGVSKSKEILSFLTLEEILFSFIFSLFPIALIQLLLTVKNFNSPFGKINFIRGGNYKKIISLRPSLDMSLLKSKFYNFINDNVITILIILLLFIVATDKFYNNLNLIIQPEGVVTRGFPYTGYPSSDFSTSVFFRTNQMIKGEVMDISVAAPGEVDASGALLPLFFSPFLIFFKPNGFTSYFSYLIIVASIFIFFFTALMRGSSQKVYNEGLIFLVAFFLTVPGYLGIFQGNIDILLAPLTGIFILFTLNLLDKKIISKKQYIVLGVFAGALLNIKITILPLLFSAIIFSKRKILIVTAMSITFLVLVYAPNLFGSKSNFLSHLSNILAWRNVHPLDQQFWANHSIFVISSFFTRCFDFDNCDSNIFNNIIAFSLFFIVLTVPFLYSINRKFLSHLKKGWNRSLLLVLLTLSVAFANLSFKIIYDYRLYFSVIVTLIILKESARNTKALFFTHISIFCLLLGGLWAMRLAPNEFGTIDPRLFKIFFLFHFVFLISASVNLWKKELKMR